MKQPLTDLAPYTDRLDLHNTQALFGAQIIAAVHEAAHVVAHLVTGETFSHVEIREDPAGGWSGSTYPVPGSTVRPFRQHDEAVVFLAGPAAQYQLIQDLTGLPHEDLIDPLTFGALTDYSAVRALRTDAVRAEVHAVVLATYWQNTIHRVAVAIVEAPGTTLDYEQCLAVTGPRMPTAFTQAHQRQIDRAYRAYIHGALPLYEPLAQELADASGRSGANRTAA